MALFGTDHAAGSIPHNASEIGGMEPGSRIAGASATRRLDLMSPMSNTDDTGRYNGADDAVADLVIKALSRRHCYGDKWYCDHDDGTKCRLDYSPEFCHCHCHEIGGLGDE